MMKVIGITCPYCGREVPLVVGVEVKGLTLTNTKTLLDKIEFLDVLVIDLLNLSRREISKRKLYLGISKIYEIGWYEFEILLEKLSQDGLIMFPRPGIVKAVY